MKSVLQYLSESVQKFSDKIAVVDENGSVTYGEYFERVACIGNSLSGKVGLGRPVGVFLDKSIDTLCVFLGTIYAGGSYSNLNPDLPENRLGQIVSVLSPEIIITDRNLFERAEKIFRDRSVLLIEDLLGGKPEWNPMNMIDTEPLYINFTSGSTGVPKGIVVNHRSVIDFIDCFTKTFAISEKDVIANQAPFDFDVSVKDIYSALKVGATLVIVPKSYFSVPVKLVDFLCDHNVTTMIWAVSALCLLSTFHAFDYRTPESLNKILFSGEVMPLKHLKSLKNNLPNATFVNLYGPTEITCNCTYHILQNDRDYTDGIPIGKPFDNEDVFLLDENDTKIDEVDSVGEICVRGTALALGYYMADEQTKKSFVQNPLNKCYPELIYRTGDLGKFDENGDLYFSGRKDFQIKYLGHRIELEEIERAIGMIEGVERCCCLFDEKRSRLKGFYVGEIEKNDLFSVLKEKLPAFMIPGTFNKIDNMPLTKNGKVDRKFLATFGGGTK